MPVRVIGSPLWRQRPCREPAGGRKQGRLGDDRVVPALGSPLSRVFSSLSTFKRSELGDLHVAIGRTPRAEGHIAGTVLAAEVGHHRRLGPVFHADTNLVDPIWTAAPTSILCSSPRGRPRADGISLTFPPAPRSGNRTAIAEPTGGPAPKKIADTDLTIDVREILQLNRRSSSAADLTTGKQRVLSDSPRGKPLPQSNERPFD